MKKYFSLIIISIITITGCEQDSICIDATTPSLTILFYDYNNRDEIKSINLDSVWAEDKSLYLQNVSLDSLSIPLDLNENFTVYNLGANALVDEIKFDYSKKDVFVGRSCGYKTVFENLEITNNTSNWIKEIEIINTIIDNDTAAQVYIFH